MDIKFYRHPVERHHKNLQIWKTFQRQERKGDQLSFLSVLLVSGGII